MNAQTKLNHTLSNEIKKSDAESREEYIKILTREAKHLNNIKKKMLINLAESLPSESI